MYANCVRASMHIIFRETNTHSSVHQLWYVYYMSYANICKHMQTYANMSIHVYNVLRASHRKLYLVRTDSCPTFRGIKQNQRAVGVKGVQIF